MKQFNDGQNVIFFAVSFIEFLDKDLISQDEVIFSACFLFIYNPLNFNEICEKKTNTDMHSFMDQNDKLNGHNTKENFQLLSFKLLFTRISDFFSLEILQFFNFAKS